MKYIIPFILVFMSYVPAYAEQNKAPLEITAQETLEWHRDQKKFIARGDVIATQGLNSLHSDLMTGTYTEDQSFQLTHLTAEGHVIISSPDGKAYGDQVLYNVASSVAEMTGTNLKLITAEQTVTARDTFIYEVNAGKLSANGEAKAVQGDHVITADTLSAFFENQKENGENRALKRLEAFGNVIITTPTEVLRGNRGIYNKQTNIAELSGNVTITRAENILNGERATINLLTNVSTLFGTPSSGGRVRGVFYPGSEKKN